jgi:hypothetical protein
LSFRRRAHDDEGRDKAVALTTNRLYEAGLLFVFAECLADLSDGGVDAVFGVYEYVAFPKALRDFISGDNLTPFRREQD